MELAYVELAQPLVPAALEALAPDTRRIVVVPLFLFAAGHVKNDLPLAVDAARARFPATELLVAPCLGVHPSLISLAWDRVAPAIPEEPAARAKTLPPGRRPWRQRSRRQRRLLQGRTASSAKGAGLANVEPTFTWGSPAPKTPQSLELVARTRPDHVVVLPYLLFAGRLRLTASRSRGARVLRAPSVDSIQVVAPHLGRDERLLALLGERVANALTKTAVLPCDTCQYRAPIGAVSNQVGGLRALLYSARHTLMRSQAQMPVHLHKPLKKHVLVCGNADCADRGSGTVLDLLRRTVKNAGRTRDIKITRTSCMGRCGEGPTVAVYPDGVWYRGVRPVSDAGDRPRAPPRGPPRRAPSC